MNGLSYLILIFVLFFPLAASSQELMEIKPPVDYPSSSYLLYSFIILGLLLMILLAFYIKNLTGKKDLQTPQQSWQKAYRELEDLNKKNLPSQGKINEYYSELSDIIRCYIEERFALRAPEMTTQEFLSSLNTTNELNAEKKQFLADFLNSCDMVKFAKHQTLPEETQESFRLAKRFIEETKNSA